MRMLFDFADREELGNALIAARDELIVEMRQLYKEYIGPAMIEDITSRIRRGVDLNNVPLKPNEPSTYRRKKAAKEKGKGTISTEPLIDKGILVNKSLWKVGIRKSKKGTIHVTPTPPKERKLVFAKLLPSEGYRTIQGISGKIYQWAVGEVEATAGDVMRRYIGE